MRYQITQSQVNTDSWYVDDTEQQKTIAVFLKPYGKLYAEYYAEWLNASVKGFQQVKLEEGTGEQKE